MNSDNGDNHDHDHDNDHMDESLNYPFHYHYEMERLRGPQNGETDLPEIGEFVFSLSEDSVEPANSPALFNFAKDIEGVDWLFATVSGDEEDQIILGEKPVDPDSGLQTLGWDNFLDKILEQGFHLILNLHHEGDNAREIAGTVLDELSRIWDEDCPHLIIASESPSLLDLAVEIMPNQPRLWYLNEAQAEQDFADMGDVIEKLGIAGFILRESLTSEARLDALMNYERPIAVITADSPLSAKRLQQQGADYLISPFAHILQENL